MSDKAMHFWTVFNGVCVGVIGIMVVGVLCWMARDFFWAWQDKRMQKHLRIKNSQLDHAYRTNMFAVGRGDAKDRWLS